MKKFNLLTWYLSFFVLCGTTGLQAQMAANAESEVRAGFGWELSDLFEESDVFSDGATFLWADYQVLSTLGDRPDRIGTVIPAAGLHLEKHLWHNLGVRLDANLHVWNEDKALATTGELVFTEEFEYRYWTAAIGGNWHFYVNDRWDPYVGIVSSYRRTRAFCDCVDESKSSTSVDLLIGTRYFLGDKGYLMFEAGQHGVGFVGIGLGLKFD